MSLWVPPNTYVPAGVANSGGYVTGNPTYNATPIILGSTSWTMDPNRRYHVYTSTVVFQKAWQDLDFLFLMTATVPITTSNGTELTSDLYRQDAAIGSTNPDPIYRGGGLQWLVNGGMSGLNYFAVKAQIITVANTGDATTYLGSNGAAQIVIEDLGPV